MIQKFIQFLRDLFWTKPVEVKKPKATEVLHNYVCVKYHDQWINLRKHEVPLWNKLQRRDRRAMANKFKKMEQKGLIKFVMINGNMTCIKNKDYENA